MPWLFGPIDFARVCFFKMVGAARLELATPRSQSECATKLRHAPNQIFQPICSIRWVEWGEWWESNPRPPEPQSGALPTELHSPYTKHYRGLRRKYLGFTSSFQFQFSFVLVVLSQFGQAILLIQAISVEDFMIK